MQANEREQTQSSFPAVHCKGGCTALQERMQCTAEAVAVHCGSGCCALRKRLLCTAGKGHIMADERSVLWRTALQAAFVVYYLYRGRCPRLLIVVPSRHRSADGVQSVVKHCLMTHSHHKLIPPIRGRRRTARLWRWRRHSIRPIDLHTSSWRFTSCRARERSI